MTNIQVRDIKNKKAAAIKEQKLVYRGVAYLKKSTQQAVQRERVGAIPTPAIGNGPYEDNLCRAVNQKP